MMVNKEPKAMAAAHPEQGWMADHPDLPVPIVEDPTCFDSRWVGAAAERGAYFYGAGGTRDHASGPMTVQAVGEPPTFPSRLRRFLPKPKAGRGRDAHDYNSFARHRWCSFPAAVGDGHPETGEA